MDFASSTTAAENMTTAVPRRSSKVMGQNRIDKPNGLMDDAI